MGNRYSPTEFVENVISLLMTKIIIRNARFIRRPIYIRGRRSLVGGKGLTTGRFCRFDLDGRSETLFIGENCEFGDMTHIVARERVDIGNNVLIASKCFISDTSHGVYKGDNQDSPATPPNQRQLVTKPVRIGNNVWVGENAVILAGSVIGEGCIIGANAVVSGNVEENCIVVGSGTVLKKYNKNNSRWELVRNDNLDKA